MTEMNCLKKRSCVLALASIHFSFVNIQSFIPILFVLTLINFFLSFILQRFEDNDPTIEISTVEGHRLLAEADGPIGLQSYRMEIADGSVFGREDGEGVVFEAGPPFWRE